MKLGDYANIRTGLVLSRKVARTKAKAHNYTALTLKAQTVDGLIEHNLTEEYFAVEPLKREYFTQTGDVVLRLSAPYTATFITEETTKLLVSAHFTIIRVANEIDPVYLQWWLTQNRKRFYQSASGIAIMGTISSGYVAEMKFSPPPIEQQRKVGQLLLLTQREQQLLRILAERKKTLVTAIISAKFKEDE